MQWSCLFLFLLALPSKIPPGSNVHNNYDSVPSDRAQLSHSMTGHIRRNCTINTPNQLPSALSAFPHRMVPYVPNISFEPQWAIQTNGLYLELQSRSETNGTSSWETKVVSLCFYLNNLWKCACDCAHAHLKTAGLQLLSAASIIVGWTRSSKGA